MSQRLGDLQLQDSVMQFLMGLNKTYGKVRTQILLMGPISSINKVYSLLIQEERQQNVGSYVAPHVESTSLVAKSSSGSKNKKNWKGKDKPTCSHYSLNNHTVDKCYKVHGYPPGYKQRGRGSSSVNQVSRQDDQSNKHS